MLANGVPPWSVALMLLERCQPWPMPEKSKCDFYHCMDFPDGESVTGEWDIRGRFDQYIGHYPLAGKTVLDVGTASGFLAFSAEAAGANVTATDVQFGKDMSLLPYRANSYFNDRQAWNEEFDGWKPIMKNGFWYAWHKFNSRVDVAYNSLMDLAYTDDRFDVVIAGAILEHLSDPVSVIGVMARVAKEAVIIGFTPVVDTDQPAMVALTTLTDPKQYFTWWALSRGLYKRVFDNVGFDIQIVPSSAYRVSLKQEETRATIIARRRA
ncbi:MAG: methyltransferase domain-containing protein [Candidatus Eremiobacteraeota bacterium]|nr:methyltransferase domain-containing protein [Candidatus Eremiobacteraeota bacterium]